MEEDILNNTKGWESKLWDMIDSGKVHLMLGWEPDRAMRTRASWLSKREKETTEKPISRVRLRKGYEKPLRNNFAKASKLSGYKFFRDVQKLGDVLQKRRKL